MLQPAVRCVELVEWITEWMEGALDDETRLALEEHLVVCPHCTEYVEQLRLAAAPLRAAPTDAATEAPPAEARAALLAAFRERRA